MIWIGPFLAGMLVMSTVSYTLYGLFLYPRIKALERELEYWRR